MAAPGMNPISGPGMQNMANMGTMPQQMTPQQQQMMHAQQQHQMAQFQQQQHHPMAPSPQQMTPQQQMMMHQQQQQQQQQMGHPQQQGPPMHMQQQQGMMPGQPMQQPRAMMQQPQQQHGPSPQPDLNPVMQAKMLMPQLKESLVNLMRVAAQTIHQNGLIDSCSKSSSENPPPRLDKFLEEFYAICDQMELNLRLAIECNSANADSAKHTPLPVQTTRQDPNQPDSQTYQQFLSLVKMQAAQAKEVRDMLMEGVRKLSDHPT